MATNPTLKKLVEDIAAAKAAATEDLSGWDHRTAAGAHLRKSMAQDELRTLTSAYRTAIQNFFVRVFVSGPRAEAFAASAAKEGAIVVDGNDLYKLLAKGVFESQDPADRKFGPFQFQRLVMEMSYYGAAQNYRSFMSPNLETNDLDTQTPTFDDLVAKVRRAVRGPNKDELNRLHLEKQIVTQALDRGVASNVIPVIITGLTAEETQEMYLSLFGGTPAFDVVADEQTADADLLKTINKKIQSVVKASKQ